MSACSIVHVLALSGLGCARAPAPPAIEQLPADPTCATLREGAVARRPGLGRRGSRVAIGLVADTREPLPETLDALRRFAAAFRAAHVDAVAALGDLAGTDQGVHRIVDALRPAGAPVFALDGEAEPEGPFHDGLDRARTEKDAPEVIDLQRTRVVDGDGLDLVSLPGYAHPSYLTDGCRYRASDLTPLGPLAARLDGPTILLSHTPPHGDGDAAIDRAYGDTNAGDPAINRLLADGNLRFGAFAHIDEAGGRASDGRNAVPPATWSDRLYVNVGSADALAHRPQAILFEIEDNRARYSVIQ